MHEGRVGPGTFATMTAEAVDEKVGFVTAAAGARLASIEMNIRVFMPKVTDQRDKVLADLSAGLGRPVDQLTETPFAFIGSPAKIVDDLLARRERWGFSYVIVGPEEIDSFAPVIAELAGRDDPRRAVRRRLDRRRPRRGRARGRVRAGRRRVALARAGRRAGGEVEERRR